MKVAFTNTFLKDIKKLRNQQLKDEVTELIQKAESVQTIFDLKNVKKLKGYDVYYRIRVGDFRIGLKLEGDILHFAAIDHRKDIYKNFP